MKTLLLDVLSCKAGGQIVRTNSIIKGFEKVSDNVNVIVIKSNLNEEINISNDFKVINLYLPKYFDFLLRTFYQNIIFPILFCRKKHIYYLTFSHYVPFFNNFYEKIYVGVTNLSPFSKYSYINSSIFLKLKLMLLKKSIIKSCVRATHVICISRFCLKILRKNGISENKLSLLYNGFSAENFDTLDVESNIDHKYILYVSHFHNYKNFETLIKAFYIVVNQIRELKLVLIGDVYDTNYFTYLKRLTSDLKLTQNVIFIHKVKHNTLYKYYKNTDLFVYCSLIENCPNILLESISLNCNILCVNKYPMKEFVFNKNRLFNSHDHDKLAYLICYYFNKKKFIKNDFLQPSSWEVFSAKLNSLILFS